MSARSWLVLAVRDGFALGLTSIVWWIESGAAAARTALFCLAGSAVAELGAWLFMRWLERGEADES